MKKSLLFFTAGMFAFAATAQETTEPAFVAQELDGKTITLTCASGTDCNGYYLIINGTSLAGAADHGTNPYKWVVEYDAEEQGMILSAGGYYIGRVPNAVSGLFTLTQDKELAGRYRLYPNSDITSDDIQRYCLTATKFVNGNENTTISQFGTGDEANANHWMHYTTSGLKRWGSLAPSSKWVYTVVETEPQYIPVTSATQIVDGGKYIIAAYNHHWGTTNHADKRFLKLENSTITFVTATSATAENAIWTAHASSAFTCNSSGHARGNKAKIVTFSQEGESSTEYLKWSASGTPTSTPAGTSATDALSVFELYETASPTIPTGATAYANFIMHYKATVDANKQFFRKTAMISSGGKIGAGSLDTQSKENEPYQNSGDKYTSHVILWRVIETEADLYSHANAILTMCGDRNFGPGLGQYNLAGNTSDVKTAIQNIISGKENSTEAVSIADIDAFVASGATKPTTRAENIHLNMPKTGTYLKFNGAASSSNIRDNAALFYTTTYSMSNDATPVRKHMTVDKTNTNAGYTDAKAIMYLEAGDETGDRLLSYATGYYLGLDAANGWPMFKSEADMTEAGGNTPAVIGIAPGTSTNSGSYQINFITNSGASRCGIHINGSNSAKWYVDRCGIGNSNPLRTTTANEILHDWFVTLITELPVELGTDGYGSFYAPVAVSFPEGVTVYAAEVSDTDIQFNVVDFGTVIAPGTPVILVGTPSTTVNATIDYDYQPAADEPAVLAETAAPAISFYGKTAVEKLPAEEGVFTFQPTAGENGTVTMTKVEANSCLPVNTMLMSMPETCTLIQEDGTVALSLENPNNTTGIREIGADNANNSNGAIYDLQGRRLSAPVKGINIINGRKVLVR